MSRSIVVRRAAESRALVHAGDVVTALGLSSASQIEQAKRIVNAVSAQVEQHTERVFARELITERFGLEDLDVGGMGNIAHPFRLMLSRRPILMVEAVRFDGQELDLADISIEDSEAGFLYSANGFQGTTIYAQQLERVRTGYRQPLYEVDYSAGYILPTFPKVVQRTVTADAVTNKFTLASHPFVLGDTVRFMSSGALPGGLSAYRDYYVRDAGANDFAVTAERGGAAVDLTDTGSGSLTVTRQVTLPDSLQNDVIELVNVEFTTRGRDRSILSEKLGDYSVTYADEADVSRAGFPKHIAERLERLRNIV